MRGDIHELNAARGARGHEQARRGYAVVVQSGLLPLSTRLVAPTSRRARKASFRPDIEVPGRQARVLVEQTTAADPTCLGRVVGHLSDDELAVLDRSLIVVLGLDRPT